MQSRPANTFVNRMCACLQVVKNMAFSVYSQITKKVRFTCPSRTMTGFGPVSQQEPLKNLMTTLCEYRCPPPHSPPTPICLHQIDT